MTGYPAWRTVLPMTSTPSVLNVSSSTPLSSTIGIGAGIALAVGSFLPWFTLTAPLIGTVSKSGVDGSDGWLTLVAGAVIAGIAYSWRQGGQHRVLELVVAVLAAAMVAYEYVDIGHQAASVSADLVVVNSAAGLHLCALGALAGVVAAVIRHNELRTVLPAI